MAGVIGQTLIYPLEIARTCLSVSPAGTYKGITDCTISIFRQGGSRALYNGWGASTLGIMPYAGLDLGINSLLRERVAQYYQGSDTEPGIVTMLGCGMVSATVAMLVTYPIGLVRTRLQASSIPGSPKFNGIVDCTRQTYKGGGLRAFYRGVVPTTVKVVPAAAISYAGYVWISEYLERRYTTMLATA